MLAGLEVILVKGQRARGLWGAVLVLPGTRQQPLVPSPGVSSAVAAQTHTRTRGQRWARHFMLDQEPFVGPGTSETQAWTPRAGSPRHRAARAPHLGLRHIPPIPSCSPQGRLPLCPRC